MAVRDPPLVHWFIHSSDSSFVHWYVHSFVCSFFHALILSLGPPPPPQPNTFHHCIYWKKASRDCSDCFTLCKVSNELAYWSNVSVDSLAFHRFGTEQGGISWRNQPVSKIWILVYWKKVSRFWSDCCTRCKIFQSIEFWIKCFIRM